MNPVHWVLCREWPGYLGNHALEKVTGRTKNLPSYPGKRYHKEEKVDFLVAKDRDSTSGYMLEKEV